MEICDCDFWCSQVGLRRHTQILHCPDFWLVGMLVDAGLSENRDLDTRAESGHDWQALGKKRKAHQLKKSPQDTSGVSLEHPVGQAGVYRGWCPRDFLLLATEEMTEKGHIAGCPRDTQPSRASPHLEPNTNKATASKLFYGEPPCLSTVWRSSSAVEEVVRVLLHT